MTQDVPPRVRRYAERAVSGSLPAVRAVRVMQSGEMWLKPGGRPLAFTAVEDFDVEAVGFSWRAGLRLARLVWLAVKDGFADGEGALEVRLFGRIRVQRATGPEVSVGEAQRYLAEMVWAPHALLANPELEWRELDAGGIEVSTPVGSRRAAVHLEFDPAGDIVGVRCDARPRTEGKRIVSRPWAGTFADFATVGGVRLPTRGEVWWDLPDGRFTYWRGRVTALELMVRVP